MATVFPFWFAFSVYCWKRRRDIKPGDFLCRNLLHSSGAGWL